MDANKLLDCPFCGGEARIHKEADHHGYFYSLGCVNAHPFGTACKFGGGCYTETEDELLLSEAITAWNRRADSKHRATVLSLLKDVIGEHTHDDNHNYNECDKDECTWCSDAKAIIKAWEPPPKGEQT